jgi:hypothetical protein
METYEKKVKIVDDFDWSAMKVRLIHPDDWKSEYDMKVRVVSERDSNYDLKIRVAELNDFNYQMKVKVINPNDIPSKYRRWYPPLP